MVVSWVGRAGLPTAAFSSRRAGEGDGILTLWLPCLLSLRFRCSAVGVADFPSLLLLFTVHTQTGGVCEDRVERSCRLRYGRRGSRMLIIGRLLESRSCLVVLGDGGWTTPPPPPASWGEGGSRGRRESPPSRATMVRRPAGELKKGAKWFGSADERFCRRRRKERERLSLLLMSLFFLLSPVHSRQREGKN